MRRVKSKQGASLIEYTVLLVIILSGLYVMKDIISQGIFSKYRQTGESMSFGRQFDAKRTTIIRQDATGYTPQGDPIMGVSYNEDCYYARVMRKPILITSPSGEKIWDPFNGGCPTCDAGNVTDAQACFACEQAIKVQCKVVSAN